MKLTGPQRALLASCIANGGWMPTMRRHPKAGWMHNRKTSAQRLTLAGMLQEVKCKDNGRFCSEWRITFKGRATVAGLTRIITVAYGIVTAFIFTAIHFVLEAIECLAYLRSSRKPHHKEDP